MLSIHSPIVLRSSASSARSRISSLPPTHLAPSSSLGAGDTTPNRQGQAPEHLAWCCRWRCRRHRSTVLHPLSSPPARCATLLSHRLRVCAAQGRARGQTWEAVIRRWARGRVAVGDGDVRIDRPGWRESGRGGARANGLRIGRWRSVWGV